MSLSNMWCSCHVPEMESDGIWFVPRVHGCHCEAAQESQDPSAKKDKEANSECVYPSRFRFRLQSASVRSFHVLASDICRFRNQPIRKLRFRNQNSRFSNYDSETKAVRFRNQMVRLRNQMSRFRNQMGRFRNQASPDSETKTADSETKSDDSETKPGDSATTIQKPKQPIQKPKQPMQKSSCIQKPSWAMVAMGWRAGGAWGGGWGGTMAKVITFHVDAKGF